MSLVPKPSPWVYREGASGKAAGRPEEVMFAGRDLANMGRRKLVRISSVMKRAFSDLGDGGFLFSLVS